MNVLLVEDEEIILTLFKYLLNLEFTEVFTATDGIEATKVLAENFGKIDAVITDYMMPNMNGMQLLFHIKSVFPDLPVFAHSAHDIDELQQSEFQFDGVFAKPVGDTDAMIAHIIEHVQQKSNCSMCECLKIQPCYCPS